MAHKCDGCGLYIEGSEDRKCDSPTCPGGFIMKESDWDPGDFESTFGFSITKSPKSVTSPEELSHKVDPWDSLLGKL